ncbi:MAG: tyrosine-type recombinase/integrase [Hyphomonadaceae bacterium]|nr:tyrosine-type recombinase/integrase [Hyphomonadaceae bacterium]
MLKLVRRGKKGVFQIIGTVAGQRVRESTGVASQEHAEVIRAKREAALLEEATWGKRYTATFSEAVNLYAQKGGSPRYVEPLNLHFGKWRMDLMTDLEVSKFATKQYPDVQPQTLDRQVYTPLIAIWHVAQEAKLCGHHDFKRPMKPDRQAVEYAKDDYLSKILPASTQRLQAAVLLMSFTGARGTETCNVSDENGDVDWEARTVLLRKTKNGRPRLLPLAPLLYEKMLPLKGTKGPLFGFKQRFSLNQALERAANRAKVPYLSSHKIGRHSAAARLLGEGYTLKEIQEALGWSPKSLPMIAEIYGHLEQKRVDQALREADTKLAQLMDLGGNVERFQKGRKE